ncbi:MAG: thermosome subunit [Euryarchaeota archaeon]|nr:thermosome subunit [Euryarchaeota archaeon]
MGANNNPIYIMREGNNSDRGRDAKNTNVQVARVISDAIKTTLGPRGMDKMLVSSLGDVTITNDGFTILTEVDVQHPAAKMLVEVAKAMDEECGDGTTTAVLLTGELLKKSQELSESKIHPTVIARGYGMASKKAIEVLESISRPIGIEDRKSLLNIARTSMMSKAVVGVRDMLAELSVDATKAISEKVGGKTVVNLGNISILKKVGGSVVDTSLIMGMVLDKGPMNPDMPKKVEKAKIALITSALEMKKTQVDAKIEIDDPTQMQAFLEEEEKEQRDLVEGLLATGANVIFCQKGIGDEARNMLSRKGIYAMQKLKATDMAMLSKACGANLVGDPAHLEKDDLGHADLVEARKLEEVEMTFVTGCKNPKAVTILIRGGTEHVVSETDRSLDDSLNVVRLAMEDGRMNTGAGASAMEISLRLKEYASSVSGREQIVIKAYAEAMESIPSTLAANAGLDVVDILIAMRSAHANGNPDAGVNVFTGKVEDMWKMNIIEPFRIGKQAISSATDTAIMLIRIDDVIASKGGPGPAPMSEE